MPQLIKLLLVNGAGGVALGLAFAAFLLLNNSFGLRVLLFSDPNAAILIAMFAGQLALFFGVCVASTAVIAMGTDEE
jgi:hypothetical protein